MLNIIKNKSTTFTYNIVHVRYFTYLQFKYSLFISTSFAFKQKAKRKFNFMIYLSYIYTSSIYKTLQSPINVALNRTLS